MKPQIGPLPPVLMAQHPTTPTAERPGAPSDVRSQSHEPYTMPADRTLSKTQIRGCSSPDQCRDDIGVTSLLISFREGGYTFIPAEPGCRNPNVQIPLRSRNCACLDSIGNSNLPAFVGETFVQVVKRRQAPWRAFAWHRSRDLGPMPRQSS